MYLGLTQATASWLLGKAGLLDSIYQTLIDDTAVAMAGEFVGGPLRISATVDQRLVCAWNVDYLSGAGDDSWGFVHLGTDLGLASRSDIGREVLERCLYVISQRLQGLLIDGAFIHRSWPNGVHTCLAGRGADARKVSIAYVERDVQDGTSVVHSVLCIGPEYDLARLSTEAARRAAMLGDLLPAARKLYDPRRRKPPLATESLPRLRAAVSAYIGPSAEPGEFGEVSIPTGEHRIPKQDSYRTVGWHYRDWLARNSPLSPVQHRLLFSDALDKHPVRIIGPAGSGKTLLMELLALRRLEIAADGGRPCRVLYLVHNEKMADTVRHRLVSLLAGSESLQGDGRSLDVRTLSEYGREQLNLAATQIIDSDAHEAKEFQLEVLRGAVEKAMAALPAEAAGSALFREVTRNPELAPVLIRLLMSEISTAIKGHGLVGDERRYVESDRALSRLHAALGQAERRIVFRAFSEYQKTMFDGYGVLDSDDVALSLVGKLRTPIWELKRRELGFDHVFVDETQLFNENERRVLPLLARSVQSYVPIVLALDEAQDLVGQTAAGMAALGIENAASESLESIHRSSRAIIRLAFFVIQRSTHLFGPEFPNFTGMAEALADDTHPLPRVEVASEGQPDFGRFVLRRIRALRRANLRRLAVVCLAEQYWTPVLNELRRSDLPLHVLESRGERLSGGDHPIVVMSRPAHVGGQEFDGVLIIGAEQGLAPPRVLDNDALASAVEQQALRELYLAITRARYQVVIALSPGASLTKVLADAQRVGLVERVQDPEITS